jgi:tripartite-type tricarboxylate transporter receptor subunit TctC
LGLEVETSTPAAFGSMIRSEIARWTQVVDAIGLKLD